MERNGLSNSGRESFKGFSIFSSGGHFLRNGLSNFGRELPKEHSSEIILKSVHWFSRSCLKLFFCL